MRYSKSSNKNELLLCYDQRGKSRITNWILKKKVQVDCFREPESIEIKHVLIEWLLCLQTPRFTHVAFCTFLVSLKVVFSPDKSTKLVAQKDFLRFSLSPKTFPKEICCIHFVPHRRTRYLGICRRTFFWQDLSPSLERRTQTVITPSFCAVIWIVIVWKCISECLWQSYYTFLRRC